MSRHLTSQQITGQLAGEMELEASRHVEQCGACAGELQYLEQSLSRFRDAVRHWSDQAGNVHGVAYGAPLFSISEPGRGVRQITRAGASSLLAHAAAVAMVITLGSSPEVREKLRVTTALVFYAPPMAKVQSAEGGGGGGGAREPLRASKGDLPKLARQQFTPPRVDPVEAQLIVPPSIPIPLELGEVPLNRYGDPFGTGGMLSNGTGSGGSIGDGADGGIGRGKGRGVGPGIGEGFGGTVGNGTFYRPGGGVSAPRLISKVEPEYSDDARKAKFQGTVTLSVVVDEKGRPRSIRVVQALGMGLDEKAIDAVGRWLFQPGMLNGKPVAVMATVEVNFRLL